MITIYTSKKSLVITLFSVLGFLFVFAPHLTHASHQQVQKEFPFVCEQYFGDEVIAEFNWPVTIKTSIPTSVAPKKEFYLTNTEVNLVLDELIVEFMFISNGIETIDVSTNRFAIASENEDQLVEIRQLFLKEGITSPEAPVQLPVPALGDTGIEQLGPFTAGESGEVKIKNFNFTTSLILHNPYVPGLALNFECAPQDEEITVAAIPIDGEAPVIKLKGDNPMIVKQGDPYVEPGATAEDNFDGDVSDKIEISGDVDTSKIGTYTITYTVSDNAGNVATAERTVNVVEPFGYWYTGEGPPSDELGFNGDSYLDLLTGDIYKRDPNTWTKIGNIKGSDGKQGSAIHTGSGAPKADLGDIGDLYLDTNTGDVYEKTADGWVKLANLKGPAGPQGPQGSKGADGSGGSSGDGKGSGKKSGAGSSKSTGKDDGGKPGSQAKGGKLPKTATSVPTLILIGAFLAAIGSVLFFRRLKAAK